MNLVHGSKKLTQQGAADGRRKRQRHQMRSSSGSGSGSGSRGMPHQSTKFPNRKGGRISGGMTAAVSEAVKQ
jgi:hypothetical protein